VLDDLQQLELHYDYVVSAEVVRDAERLLQAAGSPADLVTRGTPGQPAAARRSIRELRGLGREIWAGVSPEGYIRSLRDEWPAGE
jgi:hypothetical protein